MTLDLSSNTQHHGPSTLSVATLTNVTAGYGPLRVLTDVNMSIYRGEFLGIVGHNGAGKSTLLKVIAGALKPARGSVRTFDEDGSEILRREGGKVVMVPQADAVFPHMSVLDNLEVPRAVVRRAASLIPMTEIFRLLPILRDRRRQVAGTMSGGEQRMLAIGMALRFAPMVLLLDEPSLGIAPSRVAEIMDAVAESRTQLGYTVVMVEQNIEMLLGRAERTIALRQGSIVWEGPPTDLIDARKLWEYF